MRMLVVREIRIHNGANCCAMPTTYKRGYYLQQSGSSRWLLILLAFSKMTVPVSFRAIGLIWGI